MSAEQALAIARLWDTTAGDVAHVRTGESSAWATAFRGRRWILRLTGEEHRGQDQLEAELDFVEHLAAGGLEVARPLPDAQGRRVVDVSSLTRGPRRTWATLFERLAGRHYEYHSADLDRPLFHLWGETMGRLHELSTRFEPRSGRRRPEWHDDAVAGCSTVGLPGDDPLLPLREELVTWMRGYRPEAAHYGMVHGDFERTNFLLQDAAIGLFDFDDSCRHWFVWDVACALWVFRNATATERARFLGWLLEGYSAVRAPDAERLGRFSELIRLRTVSLILHRLRGASDTREEDRDWIARGRGWLASTWSW